MIRAKLAGQPVSPIAPLVQQNWPKPGIVNAVKLWQFSLSAICQKADVKSSVVNHLDCLRPTSARQASMDLMEYLSGIVLAFSFR